MVDCQIPLPSRHITVYRSPCSTESEDDIVLLVLITVERLQGESFILGDLNTPQVNWVTRSSSMANSFSNKLLTAPDEEFLHQAVSSPTRYMTGHLPPTLDLVFSKYSSTIHSINHLAPTGKSGHVTLQVKFGVSDLPVSDLEIYPNRKGVIIKLTYRGFCVLLTVSSGPQYHKWHT